MPQKALDGRGSLSKLHAVFFQNKMVCTSIDVASVLAQFVSLRDQEKKVQRKPGISSIIFKDVHRF